jgi:hypothetical protein
MKNERLTPFRTGGLVLLALTLAAELFTLSDDRLIGSANSVSRSRAAGVSRYARSAPERAAGAAATFTDELGIDWLTGCDPLEAGDEDPLDRMAAELLGELIVPAPVPQTCCGTGNEGPGATAVCTCCVEQNEIGPKTPKTMTALLEPALGQAP